MCPAEQFTLVFLLCYSCTFKKKKKSWCFMFLSRWKAVCNERKRKGILGLNHSFKFALNVGRRISWRVTFVRDHEPPPPCHDLFFFFFSSCLRGCQSNKAVLMFRIQKLDRETCWQPLCTWCYMIYAVYEQMMSTSTQQPVESPFTLFKICLAPVTIQMVKIYVSLHLFTRIGNVCMFKDIFVELNYLPACSVRYW